MDSFVFIAVLAAAACHAGWNTLLKFRLEPVAATALVAAASGVMAVPAVLVTGLPAPASWPYLLGSVALHVAYYLTLAEAYRGGDLGQIYPIARGTAPLMTAALASVWMHETLGIYGWAGVTALAAGILLLAFKGGRALKIDARSVGFALLDVAHHHRLHDGRRPGRTAVGRALRLHGLAVPAQRRRRWPVTASCVRARAASVRACWPTGLSPSEARRFPSQPMPSPSGR